MTVGVLIRLRLVRELIGGQGIAAAPGRIAHPTLAARGTISHIKTGLRGVSDLEMVLLANALRVKLEELVPGELPAWKKDLRPPTEKAEDGD